jgi:hypothetical protein
VTRLARRVLENPAGRFFENPATSAGARRVLENPATSGDNRVPENPARSVLENPATSAAKRTLVQARTGKDNDVTGQLSDRTLNWQDRTGQDRPMK